VKLFLFLIFLQSSFAKELPLWEVGFGVLPLRTDHYRGSPQHKWYLFPLPSYVYRGKNVEAENGYVRGHIYKLGNFTFDLSLSIGLNVNSDANHLRKGMDNLDPTFELGPIVRYPLWKAQDGNSLINLEMPYRAVYTTNLQYIDHIGYYSIPYLNYLTRASEKTFGWSSEISLGPQYGSQSFHQHFYGVTTKFVTSERSYYHAKRGYSGTQLALVLSKRVNNILILPFIRYDYLDGVAYQDSPLFKSRHFTLFGIGLIWYFGHSQEKQQAMNMVK